MLAKNLRKLFAVTMLAAIGLTACTEDIHAKPTDYNDDLLTFSEDSSIYNNIVKEIQDAYRDGTLASDVLDEVLYQYSVSVFGRYNKTAKPYNLGEGEITLKDAVNSIRNGDKTQANAFIKAHKAYWTVNDDGERIDAAGNVVANPTEADAIQSEYDRVEAKWDTIEERIAIELYNAINGTSYTERGLFSEKKFLVSLRSGLNKVANPHVSTTTTVEDVVFTPAVEDVDVFATGGYLTRGNYQSNYLLNQTEAATDAITYVEDKIIPTIYRTLLVEQYLISQSYNTLGRSYAREVNILSIKKRSDHDGATNLMKNFAKANFSAAGDTVTLEDFKAVSAAYNGVSYDETLELTATQKGWLTAAGFEAKEYDGINYYVGTEYGDMIEEYSKITGDLLTTDSTIESDFTGSYTYSKGIGLAIKTREIQGNDSTINGWYIKNGGLTTLPETIRSRLFNIGVANAVKEGTVDRFDANYDAAKESKFVAKINDAYYLKVASKENGAEAWEDVLFYDAASSTYYIIQITEAISASKLVKGVDIDEKDLLGEREEIINQVAKVIGGDESYKTLSTKHWLEQMGMRFHDTVVHEYFKENYPELYDDEEDDEENEEE